LVPSEPAPIWEVEVGDDVDEQEEEAEGKGEGEMIATITEMSSCFPPLNNLPACLARTPNGISSVSIPILGSNSVSL